MKSCHPLHQEIGKVDEEVGRGEVDREEKEGVEVEVGEAENRYIFMLIISTKSILQCRISVEYIEYIIFIQYNLETSHL